MLTGKKALLTLKCKTWALKVSKLIPHVLWKIHVPVLHTTWLKKKIIIALLELKSCTKRCVCGSVCVRLT